MYSLLEDSSNEGVVKRVARQDDLVMKEIMNRIRVNTKLVSKAINKLPKVMTKEHLPKMANNTGLVKFMFRNDKPITDITKEALGDSVTILKLLDILDHNRKVIEKIIDSNKDGEIDRSKLKSLKPMDDEIFFLGNNSIKGKDSKHSGFLDVFGSASLWLLNIPFVNLLVGIPTLVVSERISISKSKDIDFKLDPSLVMKISDNVEKIYSRMDDETADRYLKAMVSDKIKGEDKRLMADIVKGFISLADAIYEVSHRFINGWIGVSYTVGLYAEKLDSRPSNENSLGNLTMKDFMLQLSQESADVEEQAKTVLEEGKLQDGTPVSDDKESAIKEMIDHAERARSMARQLNELASKAEEILEEDKEHLVNEISTEAFQMNYRHIMENAGLQDSIVSFESKDKKVELEYLIEETRKMAAKIEELESRIREKIEE